MTKIFEILVKSGNASAVMLIEAISMKLAVRIANDRILKNRLSWEGLPDPNQKPKIVRIDIQGNGYEF